VPGDEGRDGRDGPLSPRALWITFAVIALAIPLLGLLLERLR
jgi:hypothetical protein